MDLIDIDRALTDLDRSEIDVCRSETDINGTEMNMDLIGIDELRWTWRPR